MGRTGPSHCEQPRLAGRADPARGGGEGTRRPTDAANAGAEQRGAHGVRPLPMRKLQNLLLAAASLMQE